MKPALAVLAFLGWTRFAPAAAGGEYPLSGFQPLQGVVVRAILRDSVGYVWLATDDGLWRWQRDGFQSLDHALELPGRPTCLLEDEAGALWVGTLAGVVRVDARSMRIEPGSLLIGERVVHCLYQDAAGRKWAGTDAGLFRLDRKVETYQANVIHGTQSYPITAITQGRADELWLGTKGVVLHLKGGIVTPFYRELVGTGHCQAVLRAIDGSLWVGVRGTGKLFRITEKGVTEFGEQQGVKNSEINAIIETSGGTLWVATENGVFYGSHAGFSSIDQSCGLPNSDVHALLADYEGQIWIGTYGGGVYRLRGLGVLTFGIADGLEHPFVTSLQRTSDGNIVAGTVGSVQPFSIDSGFGAAMAPSGQVAALAKDPSRRIWFGTWTGVFCAGTDLAIPFQNVMDIAFDAGGALFVGANSGLWHVPPEGDYTSKPRQIFAGNVNAVSALADGNVYAATNREVGRWKDNHWELISSIPHVRAIAWDGERLWLGNAEGLHVWDGASTKRIASLDSKVLDIAIGPNETIWAATDKGVVRVEGDKVERYSYEDGLPSRDVRCLTFDASGYLFAGTTQGLARLDTSQLQPCLVSPKLAIRRTSAADKEGSGGVGEVRIPYDHRDVLFQIDALGWRSAEGVRFRYRLDGLDDQWTPYTRDDTRLYDDLSAGAYTLNVQSINDRGMTSSVARTSFTILPPFWRETWFVASAVAALVAVTLVFIRLFVRSRHLSQAAQLAAQAKADFLSSMSHEIRSPLSIILLSAEGLAQADTNPDTSAEYVDTIIRQGRHLLSVVNDVLDYSRLSKGEYTVDFIACNMDHVLEDVRALAVYKLGSKPVELRIDVAPDVPRRIVMDPTALRQILINLMDNAVKFTDKGSISLRVSSIRRAGEEILLRFELADTGTGIPPDKRSRIFEAFKQAETSITRRFGGTGLGLTITKSLSELLGGNLKLDSTPGVGTSFTFDLPVRIAVQESPKEREPAPAIEPGTPLSGIRILLADDCPDIRRVMERLLVRTGASVVCASGGREAVTAASRDRFDVILLDLHMPGLDGFSAVTQLHELGVDTPLFAMTADTTAETQQRCMEVGFDAIITKPFDVQEVVDKVTEMVESVSGQLPTISIRPVAAGRDRCDGDSWQHSTGPIRSSLADDTGAFSEPISQFVRSLERSVGQLLRCLESKDAAGIGEVAHRLKGSGGIAGYDCVSHVAARLEVDLASGNWEATAGSIRSLEVISRRVSAGIDSACRSAATQE